MAVAQDIVDLGAEIIWVLEADARQTPGTAELCMEVMDVLDDPQVGWCVGDADTEPTARAFDTSPFSERRGFDMILPRSTMVVEFTTSHGSTGGNENISGADLLEEVRKVIEAQTP